MAYSGSNDDVIYDVTVTLKSQGRDHISLRPVRKQLKIETQLH